MKLCLAYTVFTHELLEQSIANHIDLVDGIIICYQEISNKGNKTSFPIDKFTHEKITIVKYEPNLALGTKLNEVYKHNLMIKTAKNKGFSHIILSACDHFYDKNQFAYVKQQVIDKDYDISYTKMFTYYRNPIYQITPIEDYYMPFIIKLHTNTQVESNVKTPVLVDPSVKVNTCKNWKLFSEHEIMLHHYSMIRLDIKDKFKNAAASIRWKPEQVQRFISEYENFSIEDNKPIEYFQNRKCKVVRNYFNIAN